MKNVCLIQRKIIPLMLCYFRLSFMEEDVNTGLHSGRNKFVTGSRGRSQSPRGLRRGSADARFLGLWVRIPPEACMSVTSGCCVFSDRSLCVGLITRPEEYYRVCDRDGSIMRRPWPPYGSVAPGKGTSVFKEREPSSSLAEWIWILLSLPFFFNYKV